MFYIIDINYPVRERFLSSDEYSIDYTTLPNYLKPARIQDKSFEMWKSSKVPGSFVRHSAALDT